MVDLYPTQPPAKNQAAHGPGALLGTSVRLQTLARLQATSPQAMFQLQLASSSPSFENDIRLLDGLFDTLETFWEAPTIRLRIVCVEGDEGLIERRLIRTPRLQLEIVAESSLLAKAPTGVRPAGPAETSALLVLLSAADMDDDLIISLSPQTFPIKPMSPKTLVARCAAAPRADMADRFLQAKPVGLFSRVLAVEGLDRLAREQIGGADISRAVEHAELGFWAQPAGVKPPSVLVEDMNFSDCIQAKGKGWSRQPWTSEDSPYFLNIKGARHADPEEILPHVYATLHH